MTTRTPALLLFLAPLVAATASGQSSPGEEPETLWGHSAHGAAYDAGPRQKPWKMEGIGESSFPITTSHPEVQGWFDQAITLMHGFWWYEAERSLRWCVKLDPDCAMAYWGLSIATRESDDDERSAEFLEKAVDLKDTVTERERAYIGVAEKFAEFGDAEDEDKDEAKAEAMGSIDRLLMDYPDDIEAKALYWMIAGRIFGYESRELTRYGMEAVLDDILEVDPRHVGALHYRVHTWDGKDGRYAVDTCMKLGDIAPSCGHLLHMPGHVLSGIGLWHEAAIAMDRATRVEKAYMNERMIMPEDNWDYVHNLDYLGYIQEQLGMVEAALLGAEQLYKAPAFTDAPLFASLVKNPMVRALVKYERWEELLEPDRIPWDMENPMEKMQAGAVRLRALIGLGRLEEAEDALEELRDGMKEAAEAGGPPTEGDRDAFFAQMLRKQMDARLKGLEGMLLLAKGEHLAGLALVSDAAEAQEENWSNDPPREPEFLYNFLGDQYLELGAPRLAVECFEKTLETVFHDGFALAGLVAAHAQLGETEAAQEAMAKLGVVWSDADRPNRWLERAEATGITAEPYLEVPVEQRNYKREVLDVVGPSLWIPSDVAHLAATNAEGETVTLADYRGRNVLLVFYLGEECVHCIEQIQLAEERMEDLEQRDTVVLGVSRDSVERIADQQLDLEVTLLSDPEFANARRFHSYDEFEEIELHSTFLLDRDGKLHWSRIGGEPFTDFDYIVAEIDRLNRIAGVPVASAELDDVESSGTR